MIGSVFCCLCGSVLISSDGSALGVKVYDPKMTYVAA